MVGMVDNEALATGMRGVVVVAIFESYGDRR